MEGIEGEKKESLLYFIFSLKRHLYKYRLKFSEVIFVHSNKKFKFLLFIFTRWWIFDNVLTIYWKNDLKKQAFLKTVKYLLLCNLKINFSNKFMRSWENVLMTIIGIFLKWKTHSSRKGWLKVRKLKGLTKQKMFFYMIQNWVYWGTIRGISP